jgi:4-amino-4-deoxy-L-arabinose transferase-like glycosyltransferase
MWRTGDWLLPRLNGAPYPDKPPLVFWLHLLGWSALGVGETWPRLVGAIAGLGCLGLVGVLARLLWPDRAGTASAAPIVLAAFPLFAVFATLALFDVPLTLWVLAGHVGVALAFRGRPALGWSALGLALGLGALTKGPVILLHLLPVPLLAPWWAREPRRWSIWYGGLVGAIGLGSAIAFAWAVPAGRAGGADYADAILWGQTAGRLARSFAHAEPWWWYLPLLPLILVPWAWWPPAWRGLRGLRLDPGLRFVLVALVVPFLGFCLVSGKQPNYLIPLLPAAALAAARLGDGARTARWDIVVPLAPVALLAGAVAGAPQVAPRIAEAMGEVPPLVPILLLAVVATLVVAPRPAPPIRVTLGVVAALIAVHVGFALGPSERYDLVPLARFVAEAQAEGRAIAHVGGYEGHLGFVGRLDHPIEEVRERDAVRWAEGHHDGWIIVNLRDRGRMPEPPAFLHRYRGRWTAVWSASAVSRLGRAAVVGY